MDACITVKDEPDLSTAESVSTYLSAALATNDAEVVISALKDVGRARGMSKLARDTGIDRVQLYRILREDSNPQLSTVLKLISGLGLSLSTKPLKKRAVQHSHGDMLESR